MVMQNIDWSGMRRPQPPEPEFLIKPAPEVYAFIQRSFLNQDSPLYNPEHDHLTEFDWPYIACLWAGAGYEKQGRSVLGEAEKLMINVGGWKKRRQELQMYEWFGDIPTYIITLNADYCRACSDSDFCALVEHELYHIGHKLDDFGVPKYNHITKKPILAIRGHDVEKFVGVTRRYGASEDVKKLVKAANNGPELSRADIAHGCGTCILRLA